MQSEGESRTKETRTFKNEITQEIGNKIGLLGLVRNVIWGQIETKHETGYVFIFIFQIVMQFIS